ncbi:hypothetical protein QBC38DRAFT_235629 [Podospora fimiseda]|uniref:Phosphotransferase n=1 Tax=Podospora fimiseda TaxID=252190 RepID=A0AAN7BMK3_9PEZI|nr:hypothetical protein QBC38DRAFT_235629 [Podospora fimiseda]
MMASPTNLTDFLAPFSIDTKTVHSLSHKFTFNFQKVAAESETQFLPTPITESILQSSSSTVQNNDRYLAIDIGGTNLRVAFVQPSSSSSSQPTLHSHTSHTFPSHLKSSPDLLFSWIGSHIANLLLSLPPSSSSVPLGVAFSFPMAQTSLSQAKIMQMGKGFGIAQEHQDLATQIIRGYERHRTTTTTTTTTALPELKVVAILNDAVATYITAVNKFGRKAGMGLIVGTGCNATIPLGVESLGANKTLGLELGGGDSKGDAVVVINTEWSISGTVEPLKEMRIITRWDEELDSGVEIPGFQPLEYMTGGRYLGELVRIVYLGWLELKGVKVEGEEEEERFKKSYAIGSEELSKGKEVEGDLLEVVLAVQRRAAGIVAAATVGLLRFGGRLSGKDEEEEDEVVVGYTGGCIEYFQNYLEDTQRFIDEILEMEGSKVKVVLKPCNDGGIIGAGVLAGAALRSQ